MVYGISILFIESICNDEEIIRANILEVKLGSPDYASADNVKDVVTDFCNRIKHYEKIYETICGSELESHPVDTNSMSDSKPIFQILFNLDHFLT